jgi:DNA-directed RNA polymerase specialized sigma24 family protein
VRGKRGRVLPDQVRVDSFTEFVVEHELRVRRALTAAFGSDAGREAAADAFAYAWQHWDQIRTMKNPGGYLYRVGHNQARHANRVVVADDIGRVAGRMPWVEPGLAGALASLSEQQRTVVALVHAYEWSLAEVSQVLGISKGSVQVHERRAMRRLQRQLGIFDE